MPKAESNLDIQLADLQEVIRAEGASERLASTLSALQWHANLKSVIAERFWQYSLSERRRYEVRFTFGQDAIPQATCPKTTAFVYLPLEESLRLVLLCELLVSSIYDKYFVETETLSWYYLDTLNGILDASEGLFETFDRRTHPLFSDLLENMSSSELLDRANDATANIESIGDWAVSLSHILFRGVYGVTVEHEFAHVSRRHVDVTQKLKILKTSDPGFASLIRVGIEAEADIFAGDAIQRLASLLICEHWGEFSHIPHRGLRFAMNEAEAKSDVGRAGRFVLGMVYFTYVTLRLMRTFRTGGRGGSYDDMNSRDYLVRRYGLEGRALVEMEPWSEDEAWSDGYSFLLDTMGRFTRRCISKNCAPDDGPFSLPPFAFWRRDIIDSNDRVEARAQQALEAVENWMRQELN